MEASIVCPKCQGSMRSYERNGIQIEQCSECRGIFLDRGELDRLIEAESSFVASQPDQSGPGLADMLRGGGGKHGGYEGGKHGGYEGGKHGGKRRKRGMLGELFD